MRRKIEVYVEGAPCLTSSQEREKERKAKVMIVIGAARLLVECGDFFASRMWVFIVTSGDCCTVFFVDKF